MSGTIVSLHLRQLTEADRDRIEEITRSAGLFREDEIPVALEVFDEAIEFFLRTSCQVSMVPPSLRSG